MTSRGMLVFWPFVIMAAAALWMAYALNVLPASIAELLSRVWPILLVAFGLMLLLGRRMRFGNFLALGLSLALTVGVVAVAYSQQGKQFRTDKQTTLTHAVDTPIETHSIAFARFYTTNDIIPPPNTT